MPEASPTVLPTVLWAGKSGLESPSCKNAGRIDAGGISYGTAHSLVGREIGTGKSLLQKRRGNRCRRHLLH